MTTKKPLTYRQRLARKQKQNDIVFCTLCGLALLGIVVMVIFNGWTDKQFDRMDADISECQVMIVEMEEAR